MQRIVICLCATTLFATLVTAQDLPKHLRRSTTEILETIDADQDECIVRAFVDPYPSLAGSPRVREYRWRVRVPDGSKFNIAWAHGILPKDELPKEGRRMIPESASLPQSAGDVVVVVRATNELTFEISIYPEFPRNTSPYQSTFVEGAKWVPYFGADKPTLENLDRTAESRLKPAGKHQLMKHYIERNDVQRGFAVWFEFADDAS